MKKDKMKIKRFQLLYLPVIISVLSFFIIAVISYNVSSKFMRDHMIDNSIELTELLSRKIQNELESNDQYTNQITESLLNAGSYIINNKDEISNDYLNEIADAFNIDHIYYYQSSGELVYSSDETYIGWIPKEGDPIHNFMESGQAEYVEEIRKGTETDEYYRFVYVKDIEGDFIQLGHRLETIEHLMPNQIIQSILERVIHEDDYLVYSLVTDEHLVAIADTDLEDIGIDYAEDGAYQEAIKGKTITADWYYPKLEETVIEVITPLVINDNISGIVVIGITQRFLKNTAFYLAVIIFLVTFLVTSTYLFVQRRNVIKPINKLCDDIDGINPDVPEKKLAYHENTIFYGLYDSIQKLLIRLDISKQKNEILNKEITELAYQDYLTKLPNRFSFKQDFEKLTHVNTKVAMVLLDLNNFKEVNDTRGHSYGDEILILIGQRLNDISDTNLIVSRYGGDEFMLAIGFNDQKILMNYIKIIESIFINPFKLHNELLPIKASIGVSVYPDDSENLDDLNTFSDIAMYTVKDTQESGAAFYIEKMKNKVLRTAEVKKHLIKAIENDGFKLLYQPIIDISKDSVNHYEALIRFKNQEIYPDEFIPIAESTGLIIPIGRYVIESAIKQIALWKSGNHVCTRASVNFSTKQFYDNGIIEFIKDRLKLYGVTAESLIIEITETFLFEKSSEEIRSFLTELKDMGIEIAMDDFGTGFTSIMFFNQFPFDTIKLDKSFVERKLKDNNKEAFEIWLSLFKTYNYKIVAEGVETKEQLKQLYGLGVDFVQGYYFSKPVSPNELKGLNFKLIEDDYKS